MGEGHTNSSSPALSPLTEGNNDLLSPPFVHVVLESEIAAVRALVRQTHTRLMVARGVANDEESYQMPSWRLVACIGHAADSSPTSPSWRNRPRRPRRPCAGPQFSWINFNGSTSCQHRRAHTSSSWPLFWCVTWGTLTRSRMTRRVQVIDEQVGYLFEL